MTSQPGESWRRVFQYTPIYKTHVDHTLCYFFIQSCKFLENNEIPRPFLMLELRLFESITRRTVYLAQSLSWSPELWSRHLPFTRNPCCLKARGCKMRSFSACDGSGLDGRGYLSRDRRRRGVCSECRLLVAQWPPSQLTLGNNNTQPIVAAIFCA